jgi:hypothetical protein
MRWTFTGCCASAVCGATGQPRARTKMIPMVLRLTVVSFVLPTACRVGRPHAPCHGSPATRR